MLNQSRRFPTAAVASPHHLASAAGLEVLASGGNAVDAAVAANLVLGVVAPYLCGPGGDLFAIVADRNGVRTAIASDGRAPAGTDPDQVARAAGAERMPVRGALTVTVPGAVAGWFHLLERFGTQPFPAVAAPAVRLARTGFVVSEAAAVAFTRGASAFAGEEEWQRRFGHLHTGDCLVQEDHARLLNLLAQDGPTAFYGGPIGRDLIAALAAGGSAMILEDLRAHRVVEVEPLPTRFAGFAILELPPPTQGVTAATALSIVEVLGRPSDPVELAHLQIEAVKTALHDRGTFLTDPDHMTVTAPELLAKERISRLAASIDPGRAAPWPPMVPAPGGTAYLCAADGDGVCISLIQSNFMGFGSGVVLPTYGINLQNRGAQFSLDPDAANVIAPGKRTLHTLIPSLALRDGRPWLVFGTMGGDGQPQTHLQFYSRIAAGQDLQEAITAPRWVVSPEDGTVKIESAADPSVPAGLRNLGHTVEVLGPRENVMGHAHAIRYDATGYAGATDPRTEGAIVGR